MRTLKVNKRTVKRFMNNPRPIQDTPVRQLFIIWLNGPFSLAPTRLRILDVFLATFIQRRQQELVPCLSCLHVVGSVHRLHGGRQRVLLLHGAGACRPARGHSSQCHFRCDTQTDRYTDRQRKRQTDRQMKSGGLEMSTSWWPFISTPFQVIWQTDRQTDRGRQTYIQIDRQKDRQAERQTDEEWGSRDVDQLVAIHLIAISGVTDRQTGREENSQTVRQTEWREWSTS